MCISTYYVAALLQIVENLYWSLTYRFVYIKWVANWDVVNKSKLAVLILTDLLVLSWCTGSQGNNHCSFFVQESFVSCCVLFGPL